MTFMAHVIMPIPSCDFDPTEAAVRWAVLRRRGHSVSFATPDGRPGAADPLMLTGRGLDLWAGAPGLNQAPLIGRSLRANADARAAYAQMVLDSAFLSPLTWAAAQTDAVLRFDGLLLPGGVIARGACDRFSKARRCRG